MKIKIPVIIFVVLVVAYLGVAFGSSYYAEKYYQATLVELEQGLPGVDIRIVEEHYVRGLFNSNARLVLELIPSKQDQREIIHIDSQIRTGPWLGRDGIGVARLDSVLYPNPETPSKAVIQITGGRNLMTAQTLIRYTQGHTVNAFAAPFQYNGGNMSIDFKGATLVYARSGFAKEVRHQVLVLYLAMDSKADLSTVILENMSYEGNVNHRNNGIMFFSGNGWGKVNLGKVVFINKKEGHHWKLKDVEVLNTIKTEDDFSDFHAAYKLTINHRETDEPIDMSIVVDARHLLAPSLEKIQQMANVKNSDVAQINQQERERLLIAIIQNKPTLDARLTMTYDGKIAVAQAVSGIHDLSHEVNDLSLGLLTLNKAYAQVDVQIPATFMTPFLWGDGLYLMISNHIQDGTLVRKDAAYVGQYIYDSGRVTINGKA